MGNRAFRILICLVLVCSLFIFYSPMRVGATSAGILIEGASAAAGFIPAPVAIAGIIICLGIYAIASQADELDSIVNNCISSLEKDGIVFGDSVPGYIANHKAYVSEELVSTVRDYLFDSDVISVNCPRVALSNNVDFTLNGISYTITGVDIGVICYEVAASDWEWYHADGYFALRLITTQHGMVANLDKIPVLLNNDTLESVPLELIGYKTGFEGHHSLGSVQFTNEFYRFSLDDIFELNSSSAKFLDFVMPPGDIPKQDIIRTLPLFSGGVGTAYDLSLGDVAIEDDSLAIGYPEWGTTTSGSVVEKVYPVSIPSDYDDALSQSQSEAQTGVIGGVISDAEDEVIPVPSAGVGSDTSSGTTTNNDAVTGTDLRGWLSNMLSVIISWFSDIIDAIKAIPAAFEAWFSDIVEAIQAIPGAFFEWFSSVIAAITSIPDAFAEWFEGVLSGIESLATALSGWFADIIEGLSDIISGIGSLGQVIADAVAGVFIPSEDYLTTKVDALRERFGFIDSILALGEQFNWVFATNPEPPTIVVDLSAADGDIYWGEPVVIDFSWYAPYKRYVDIFLEAFLWGLFTWRVYLRLPGLISGESGYIREFSNRASGSSRKKED